MILPRKCVLDDIAQQVLALLCVAERAAGKNVVQCVQYQILRQRSIPGRGDWLGRSFHLSTPRYSTCPRNPLSINEINDLGRYRTVLSLAEEGKSASGCAVLQK